MAAAEARAAWQRMANRCFVQEDKRPPKLACCSSSSSMPLSDSSTVDATNVTNRHALDFMHINWNSTNCIIPPDIKWWPQVQPSYGYQKEACEHPTISQDEHEDTTENASPSSRFSNGTLADANTCIAMEKNGSSLLESPRIISTKSSTRDSESKVDELNGAKGNSPQLFKRMFDQSKHWYEGDELMDWKAVDQLISRKPDEANFDLEPHWVSGEKAEPWWRVVDKDELASFIAQKSLENFDNCDLPRPQKVHISRDPIACSKNYSSFDQKLHAVTSNSFDDAWDSFSGSTDGNNSSSNQFVRSLYDSDKLYSHKHAMVAAIKDPQERIYPSDSGSPNKAELLEALCHSQTRAREAEIAAQRAFNEKEHVVKLFFKQASHLFAYKQWLRLLQLESLCLQLKIKEQQISTLLPELPRMPLKDNLFEKNGHREGKRKWRKRHKCSICRYLVAFAVGLGLASAGLLLGWTFGCLLPV